MSGEYTPESLLADLDKAKHEIEMLKHEVGTYQKEQDRLKRLATDIQSSRDEYKTKYLEAKDVLDDLMTKLVDKI